MLFLVSVAVFLLVPKSNAAFGWFAYAPLSDTVFAPGFLFLDPTHWWAVLVGIMGLVAAGWAAGFLAGRRVHQRDDPSGRSEHAAGARMSELEVKA